MQQITASLLLAKCLRAKKIKVSRCMAKIAHCLLTVLSPTPLASIQLIAVIDHINREQIVNLPSFITIFSFDLIASEVAIHILL